MKTNDKQEIIPRISVENFDEIEKPSSSRISNEYQPVFNEFRKESNILK